MRILILGLTLAVVWRLIIAAPIQQDNYADYAAALSRDKLTNITWAETRLFPGYPALISGIAIVMKEYLWTGVAIALIASLAAILLYHMILQDHVATIIWALFPPIWVQLGAKVANEPLFMAIAMFSLLMLQRKKWLLAGLIAGTSISVRLVGIALAMAEVINSPREERKELVLGIALGAALLPLYNLLVFGPKNLFYQLLANPKVGGAGGLSIGLWQLPQDVVRAFAWGQWRIAIVGSAYVLFVLVGTYLLYKYRNTTKLSRLMWSWHCFNLIFVLSLSPIPLLEEFSRYIAPSYPLLIYAYVQLIRKKVILSI